MRGVLADIDDTLTTHGRLTRGGLRGAGAAARRGQARDPDHRPAGRLVRPHRAHVAGRRRRRRERRVLVALRPRRAQARPALRRRRRDATRATARGWRRSASAILAAVPGCALASDQLYRETDLAIDFCEDVPPLPRADVDRIVALMEAEGMTAKVSSIHVNGWFGALRQADDDAAAVRRSLRASISTRARRASCSPAIRPTTRRCSRTFRTRSASPTCARSLDRIATLPAYVTTRRSGRGLRRAGVGCWSPDVSA